MTQKHFIALATRLREVKPVHVPEDQINTGRYFMWQDLKYILADFCGSQNSQFNRQLWLDYIDGKCGPNGGKVK